MKQAQFARFLDRDDEQPTRVAVEGGELVVLSRRSPGKAANEDAALVFACAGECVVVVVDGMGGENAGQRAAEVATAAVLERLHAESKGTSLRAGLVEGIEAANQAVLGLGVGAGATLAACVLREGTAQPVHVGDSMVLHVGQRGYVKALTIPHSPTGYAVEAGLLAAEEALHHEQLHVVSNYLGFERMRIELGAVQPLAKRDSVLVASDGLWDNLHLEELVERTRKGPLEAAAVELARLGGARMEAEAQGHPSKPDDLTLILFRPSGA